MAKTGSILIILLSRLAACVIQMPQDSAERIDVYLSNLTQNGKFSGSVLVAQGGIILLNKGYGMADIENQVPNAPQTRFRIHWITMPFTAIAILMLQAQGKLNVQDAICQYIPECPHYWQGISIHHLLTHTSGTSDWIQAWDSTTDRPSTSLQLVNLLKRDPPYFNQVRSSVIAITAILSSVILLRKSQVNHTKRFYNSRFLNHFRC